MSCLALEGRKEIIMPSLTYRRMADIAAWVKLTPRFCEVSPITLAITAETAAECINDQTALILGVHPIVNCCDIEGLEDLSKQHEIPLLFDSVESVYETYHLGKVGSFGAAECFSLHASKLLNGFEGGYVTTNNTELANKLSLMRGFGFLGPDNIVVQGGLNAKLNEIHAAMALANLDALEIQIVNNKNNYKRYKDGLASIQGIRLLEFNESYKTSYKNIVVEMLDDWPLSRDQTIVILNAENILARAYYSPPLHQKQMQYPYIPTDLKLTDELAQHFILLPCGAHVTIDDIDKIISLLAFLQIHGKSIVNMDIDTK